MSIQESKIMNLGDGELLYNDLRDRTNKKYTKPGSGIPSSDLAPEVRSSLDKAESAYQKPENGIPGSDLADDAIPDITLCAPVIVVSKEGAIVNFDDSISGLPLIGCSVKMQPYQDLHGYEYPWPAGGGKNIFNVDDQVDGYYISSSGVVTAETGDAYSNKIAVEEGETYTISFTKDESGSHNYRIHGYNSSEVWQSQITYLSLSEAGDKVKTFTIPSGVAYIKFSHHKDISDIQIEKRSTKSDYAPYSNICPIIGWTGCNLTVANGDDNTAEDYDATIYPITWQTEAGTVYGGTIDLITGVLTVDWAGLTKKWSECTNETDMGSGITRKQFPMIDNLQTGSTKNLCNVAPYGANENAVTHFYYSGSGTTNRNCRIFLPSSTNGNTEITVITNISVPIIYQLTPSEIRTIIGQNYIWSDVGNISVSYRADTKKYIDEHNSVIDVTLNGVSCINSSGVANIPLALPSQVGLFAGVAGGIYQSPTSGKIQTNKATDEHIKAGENNNNPIVPSNQHKSVFYALAKLVNADMNSSPNELGVYTDAAKNGIQLLFGIRQMFGPNETSLGHASQAYAIGQIFTMSGKLYKATAAIAADDVITPGTNCAETSFAGVMLEGLKDITVNGSSIIQNGVAVIPIATYGSHGVMKVRNNGGDGLYFDTYGNLCVKKADNSYVQDGQNNYCPVVPNSQHRAVFYGLSKVAGVDLKDSDSNDFGAYPDNSKNAIQVLFGIRQMFGPNETKLGHSSRAYAIGQTFTMDGKLYKATAAIAVDDVITPGTNCAETSVAENFVHQDQIANYTNFGLVRLDANSFGIKINDQGRLYIQAASLNEMKEGTQGYKPIVPSIQHKSVFYALAKAAGDTSQASSNNEVGIYTDSAKAAIRNMIGVETGITLVETLSGSDPSITAQPNVRYNCGEVASITITPPASGTCDVFFTSGSTPAVLSVPNTVKFPSWFDATAALDADTVYEIMITDGVYGSVMTWAAS